MERNDKRIEQWLVWGIFAAVLVVHVVLLKRWSDKYFIYYFNNTPVFLNAVSHVYHAMVNAQAQWFDLGAFQRYSWWAVGTYWPPVIPLVNVWTLLILPVEWFFVVNFIYLALTMVGLYLMTRLLIDNRFYSMLAAVIYSFYWFVLVQLVSYEIQLGAVAVMVWVYYWYFRSRFFSCIWPSVMFGLFSGLAIYCDHLNPALFIMPLFMVPENFKSKKSMMITGAVALFMTACAWPFYANLMSALFGDAESINFLFSQGDERVPPLEAYKIILNNPMFLVSHIFYYMISFPEKILGYGFSALFIVGAFFLPRLRKPEVRVLWMAVLVPLVIATLIVKKSFIYIFPLSFCMAVMTAVGIYLVPNRIARVLLVAGVLVAGVASYITSFGVPADLYNSKPLFSHQFRAMQKAGVPKMLFETDQGVGNDLDLPAWSIVEQVSPWIRKQAGDGRRLSIIVEFKEYPLQQTVAFLLTKMFPQHSIIGASFSGPNDHRLWAADEAYLLTNARKYNGLTPVREFDGGSWTSSEVVFEVRGAQAKLYRLMR